MAFTRENHAAVKYWPGEQVFVLASFWCLVQLRLMPVPGSVTGTV